MLSYEALQRFIEVLSNSTRSRSFKQEPWVVLVQDFLQAGYNRPSPNKQESNPSKLIKSTGPTNESGF